MNNRRYFLKISALGGLLFPWACNPKETAQTQAPTTAKGDQRPLGPVVISTWDHGLAANAVAWQVLAQGGRVLDAVEAGVKVTEADPKVDSVGYGGLPDRDGRVALDACIMDDNDNCGSVASLEHIMHPISVARRVMEATPHVLLVGEGALEFALAQGFKKENLLTPAAKNAWQEWLKTAKYAPVINSENHDTIGLLAMDGQGKLSGACTTSGLAYKMRGRVGDSPIIGAGLFSDSEVGAASATGLGESIIKIAGSHLIVELMRAGKHPEEACRLAVERLIKKNANYKEMQAGFIALNTKGEYGAYALQKGFTYAVHTTQGNTLATAKSIF